MRVIVQALEERSLSGLDHWVFPEELPRRLELNGCERSTRLLVLASLLAE